MKNYLKRIYALMLGAVCVLSASYIKSDSPALSVTAEDGMIQYVSSSVKVMQKTEYTGETLSNLSIDMSKGETEGVQVILSPRKDISSVNVKTYDLYNGFAKISKSDISVYWEKYLEIINKFNENPSYQYGEFTPDALLPMQAAIDYKENKVKAGENQGIWIDVSTYADTAPGTYSGKFDVIVDGVTYTQKLSVTVYDIDLQSVENPNNFFWVGRDEFGTNEMDSSDAMATAYYEKLLDYNIQGDLPFCGIGGAEAFAQLVKKYWDHPNFAGYGLYYERANYWTAGVTYFYINPVVLKEYLTALARLSLEDKVDYLSKAYINPRNCIDEPYGDVGYLRTEICFSRLRNALDECAIELEEVLKTHDNYYFYKETVKRSLRGIALLLPESMPTVSNHFEETMDIDYISHVNLLSFFDSETKRNEYASYKESVDEGDEYDTQNWWYTCVQPQYPYPTNHLDDDVLGLRTLYWMQELYGIDGHLNWGASNYLQGTYDNYPRDPYTVGQILSSGSLPMGDGFITYPGYPYGVYGPVMSIRAANIRDGIDDAKYMKIVKEMYAEKGVDSSEYLMDLCAFIISGTKTTSDTQLYYSARQDVIDAILSLNDIFGIYYKAVNIKQNIALLEFALNDSTVEVLYKGQKLNSEGGFYRIEQSIEESGTIQFTLKKGDQIQEVTKYLTGEFHLVSGFEANSDKDLVKLNKMSIASISNEKVDVGSKSLKLMLNKVIGSDALPYFRLNPEIFNAGNLSEVNEIYASIYNAGDTDVTLSIQTFIGTRYVTVETITLKAGEWNYITLSGVSNWTGLEDLTGIFFFVESNSQTIYLDNLCYSLK